TTAPAAAPASPWATIATPLPGENYWSDRAAGGPAAPQQPGYGQWGYPPPPAGYPPAYGQGMPIHPMYWHMYAPQYCIPYPGAPAAPYPMPAPPPPAGWGAHAAPAAPAQ
ncbi:MAG: hypothetical protein ACPGQI_04465, partial [Gammaproteobacteria bacterium]